MKFSVAALSTALFATSDAFVQRAAFRSNLVAFMAEREASTETSTVVTKDDLMGAKEMVDNILLETNAAPFFVRLAWHDAGTFDKDVKAGWPVHGGANGSIRFDPEIGHGANAGLSRAVELLEPVKDAFPAVSYADIFQMASARGIELAGGPSIDMKYGRVDATSSEQCSPEGNLPDGEAGDDGNFGGDSGTASTKDKSAEGHLRKVFYRMGFDDEGIVALSGAHTFGRAYKNRSGLGAEKTKFTDGESKEAKQVRADGKEAKYTPGGSSWTEQWLVFDNSYFKTFADENADEELLKMSTDSSLFTDDGFKPFAQKFRDDQDAFFESYAKAHKMLSELGAKYEPEDGISLN